MAHTHVDKHFKDTEEPPFGPYLNNLQTRIRAHWDTTKATLPTERKSYSMVADFYIIPTGEVISAYISWSNATPKHEAIALKAIEKAQPFDPLPASYPLGEVLVKFRFDYSVQDRLNINSLP